ncbi:hypothetical protein [Microvirga makkahensis]|uniref:hypothetical protein n=1 Tax=Microvirga makkahensis TaxID=1128670 RepID=UPI001FEB268B|nr:hypothetical protein [Microvirga makkahensis]
MVASSEGVASDGPALQRRGRLALQVHTWPETIQALWFVAVPATVLGVTWILMRGLRDILHAVRRDEVRRIGGVDRHAQGRILIDRRERTRDIERQTPPELIAREPRPFGRAEE